MALVAAELTAELLAGALAAVVLGNGLLDDMGTPLLGATLLEAEALAAAPTNEVLETVLVFGLLCGTMTALDVARELLVLDTAVVVDVLDTTLLVLKPVGMLLEVIGTGCGCPLPATAIAVDAGWFETRLQTMVELVGAASSPGKSEILSVPTLPL